METLLNGYINTKNLFTHAKKTNELPIAISDCNI